jgi:hypothetical protein
MKGGAEAWDSRSIQHRNRPFAANSPRRKKAETIIGDEALTIATSSIDEAPAGLRAFVPCKGGLTCSRA